MRKKVLLSRDMSPSLFAKSAPVLFILSIYSFSGLSPPRPHFLLLLSCHSFVGAVELTN